MFMHIFTYLENGDLKSIHIKYLLKTIGWAVYSNVIKPRKLVSTLIVFPLKGLHARNTCYPIFSVCKTN